MNRFFILVVFITAQLNLLSQTTGVGINATGSAPDPSAGLDVDFTNKGFLQPRLTTAQRNGIANPASGLSIFNTSTNCLEAYFPQFGWKKIACDCPPGPANLILVPNPINAGSAVTFSSAMLGSSYAWSFQNGSPSTSNNASVSVTWAAAGSAQVILSVDSGGCNYADTVGVTISSSPRNCLDILTANPNAASGVYTVDPDLGGALPSMSVYCDMSNHGGGWTLVLRDDRDGAFQVETTGPFGNVANLSSLTGASAKYSDAVINALRSYTDARVTYRSNNANFQYNYFHPGSCTYQHNSNNNSFNVSACMRFVSSYTTSLNPNYIQCGSWGGAGAGINCWYGCGNNPNWYTNVTISHRGYSEQTGLLNNPNGLANGSSSTSYNQKYWLWVR
ncbi:MAG: fibrinogen-like YCDxxxxGGGW domain-containing protein [Bacteroidetes bacterium]|nr:fibrinogen-like YCDxxxxGGGW domain-containing protein [Bacteroidota bacterium]